MPNKSAVLAEISRVVPDKLSNRDGFVMSVYGCSVFEKYTDERGFEYTAVGNKSGKSELIERRGKPLSTNENELVKFALKVRESRVGGAGRLEAAPGATPAKLRKIVRVLFREILPKHGYKIREEQIALSEELLDALVGRKTLLAEAPTGLGKTLVFIIVGALVKRSKINETWSGSYYPGMSCGEWERMPILVSTTSIALQTAIITDYIPAISRILESYGVIRGELTASLRKGRSHHLCEYRLHEYMPGADKKVRRELEKIASDASIIDLGEVDGLPNDAKDKISVLTKCFKNCPHREDCRYLAFRESVGKTGYDFVICNHNLLLQDMRLRAEGGGQTLPPVQALILDESHALPKVARDMYGSKFTIEAIPAVTQSLRKLNFTPLERSQTDGWRVIRDTAYRLSDALFAANKRLFTRENAGGDCDAPLKNISKNADLLCRYLSESGELNVERDERLKHSLIWELQKIGRAASELSSGGMIRWFDARDDVRTAIGGVPKDLDRRLYADLWSRRVPAMLTSGTLAVGGDFSSFKHSLGLSRNVRLAEVTHKSPFDYRKNALLYLSKNVPDYRAADYIEKLTNEIERLVTASNGHAAVLFTSYKSMRVVHSQLKKRKPDMKDFVLERGSSAAIEQFKQSGNGVLFACGSMWTGVDCPGDILSMLIIVKLPFAEPDAISEYERSKYATFGAFLRDVLTPEMLLTLRQGYGRGFRTERDTCVVAICDCRANENGAYYLPVTQALPDCYTTSEIGGVERFYLAVKSAEFWLT